MDDAERLIQVLIGVSSFLQKMRRDMFTLCDQHVSGITACKETLDSLEVDKAELKQQLEDCKRQLQKVEEYAKELTSENAVLNTRLNDMITSTASGNFRPANDYLFLVREYLRKSMTCFHNLEKAHEDMVVHCNKTETKTKQAISGTAAGVALAGTSTTGVVGTGVAASVGAIVAGAGARSEPVVGTDRASKQLEDLARGLQQVRVEIKSIKRHTTRLSTTVVNMKIWLTKVEQNRKMLECAVKLEASTTSMKRALYSSNEEMDTDYEAIMGQKKKKL